MKKRAIAAIMCLFFAFFTLSTDMVVSAGEDEYALAVSNEADKDETEDTDTVEDEEFEEAEETEDVQSNLDVLVNDELTDLTVDQDAISADDEVSMADLLGTSLLAVPAANGACKELDGSALIDSVKITKISSDGTVTELTSGGDNVISKDDKIRVEYIFNDVYVVPKGEEKNAIFDYVVAGSKYSVPGIPSICVRTDSNTVPVKNSERTLGDISFDADGNATLTIDSSFEDTETAKGATAGFDLQLDLSKDQDGSQASFDLAFGDNFSITVNVDELMAKAPQVEKSASDHPDDNGVVTWTVKLTNDSNPIDYADGYTFTDSLGSDQSYVNGTFKAKVNGADVDVTPTADGTDLTWHYKNNEPGAVMEFTYQTKMDLLASLSVNNDGGLATSTVKNNINVTAPAGEGYKALDISDTASSTFSKELEKWIDKEGGEVDENGVADWKVTVQNNGFSVYDVVLTDKIIADTGVTITVSDVKVYDKNNNEVTTYDRTYENNTQVFNLGEMTGSDTYVVTYKTKIENFDTYIKENHAVPRNEASLTYKYKKGDGTEAVIPKGPGVGKDFKNDNLLTAKAAIEKTAAGYDASNHTITWNVTVNKSKQALTNVRVTDILPKDNEFVSISNVKVGDSAVTLSDSDIDTSKSGQVTFSFGDLDGKVLTFTVTTRLTNNKVWASNSTVTYENKADLYYGSGDTVKASDKDTQECTSNVITKSAGGYDYSTRTIPYTIVVDTNQMPMDEVVVTDVLDERLEYVEGSVSGATAKYDKATNTLTFELGSITGKQTITFNAKVKDGDTFKNSGDIIIKNAATLKSAQCDVETTTPATTTKITNNVITKSGSRNNEIIDYTVNLNPAQQILYSDGVDEVVIQDTLGASLSLDLDSVHLYEGTVNALGWVAKGPEVAGATVRTDTVNGKTVLEVVVPKEKDGKAFVLTYTAYMLNAAAKDYSNNVKLKGYGSEDTNKAEVSYKESDFSSVDFSNYTYYYAELRDEYDKTILLTEGHFQLIDPETGKVVAETDIDSDGEIIFKGPAIKPNTKYKLVQTTAPEGYIIPDDLKNGKDITTADKGLKNAKAKKESHTVYDAKPKKDITISSEDGLGNPVAGSELTVTWKDSTGVEHTADSWTSDENGHTMTVSADVVYTLTESTTPFGYKAADPVVFTMGTDGALSKRDGNEFVPVGSDTITVINAPKNSATISISKVSESQGKAIEGAELIISQNSDGSNPVASWTSAGSPKELSLPEGKYYLVEKSAPVGYEIAETITFTITDDLKLEGDSDVISNNKIVMTDSYINSTDAEGNDNSPKATVRFSPVSMGIDPKLFASMKFKLYKMDSATGKLVEVTPTKVDEETGEMTYDINYQEEYIFKPTETVEGYDPVDPITIKVNGTKNEDGTVDDKLMVKALGSNVFTNSTIEELGQKVQPKVTPADPAPTADSANSNGTGSNASSGSSGSSGDTNGSNSIYNGSAAETTDDGLVIKENNIVALEQPANVSDTLAKTGGFIGTLAGYLAAIALMALGLFLVFGKEKRVK